jgi:hypothetical protein
MKRRPRSYYHASVEIVGQFAAVLIVVAIAVIFGDWLVR